MCFSALLLVGLFSLHSSLAIGDDNKLRQSVFCEGEQANFSCPEGEYIALKIANYGRFSIGICNKNGNVDWSTTCQNDKTLTILQMKCNGRSSCEIPVSNELFGDPCPKTSKYLEIKYYCTDVVVSSTTTSSTTSTSRTTSTTTVAQIDLDKTAIAGPPPFPSVTVTEISCPSISERGITWPKTQAGRMAEVRCPAHLHGGAYWFCSTDGQWSTDGYDLSRCANDWSRRLQEDAEEIDDPNDRVETLREIEQMTNSEEMYGGDLVSLSTVIESSIQPTLRSDKRSTLLELVVESVNNMARESKSSAWKDLNRAQTKKVADTLLNSVDRIGAAVASTLEAEVTKHCTASSIIAEISNVKVHDYVKFPSMSLYSSAYDTVDVPKEALTLRRETRANARVVYVTYKNMSPHFRPDSHVVNGKSTNRELASNITSVSIVDDIGNLQAVNHLAHPVIITFLLKKQNNLTSPQCVWWDRRELEWSLDGCHVQSTNRTHTVCHCSHMTHFAVIMDIRGDEYSPKDEFILTFITYAGCGLSIVCLFLSIIAFQCFGRSGGDRIFIHKNLCLSLMVAEAVFLFGIWQTGNKLYCSVIAGVLHYFFLALFIWMLLEGIELYRMLVEVFPTSSKKSYLFLTGYGVPAVVVGISAWVDSASYGTERYCWLKPLSYCFYFSFIAPVAAIIFFNFAFLVMTLRIVDRCRNSPIRYKCRDDRTTVDDVGKWVKGAAALIFLLGLTWIFGFFWVDERNMMLVYIFVILNPLQGLFIFLFHVAFNSRMQDDICEWARHSSWVPRWVHGRSLRSHPAPYMPGNRVPYGLSSNSSTGSELLYPSLTIEKYPQRMVASIDPRYNTSVHMMYPRNDYPPNGVYDYATIAYDSLCSQPLVQTSYFNQLRQHPVHTPLMYVSESQHFRPPPNFPPPPPPPPAPGVMEQIVNSPRPYSSTLTKVSDDSAYSDGSSTFQYPNETNSSSGMLLRMDLTRNPPVFVQGL